MEEDLCISNIFNFVTEHSKDISNELLKYGLNNINRVNYILKLINIIDGILANKIENGIFEFALVYVTLHNYEKELLQSIYIDKFNEIYMNLDINSRFKNETLREGLLTGLIKPEILAFMSPQQINPANWIELLNKNQCKEDVIKNMATTDLYTCRKCKGKKFKITEIQTRSADEPSTKFVTCLECYATFVTN